MVNITLDPQCNMTRWKSDAKEFEVKINYHETRGDLIFLPKPISDLLGKPNTITFVIKGGKIEIM